MPMFDNAENNLLRVCSVHATQADAVRHFERDAHLYLESSRDPIMANRNKTHEVCYVAYPTTLRRVSTQAFHMVLIDRDINTHLAPGLTRLADRMTERLSGGYHYV